jgi:hypothetical protein
MINNFEEIKHYFNKGNIHNVISFLIHMTFDRKSMRFIPNLSQPLLNTDVILSQTRRPCIHIADKSVLAA